MSTALEERQLITEENIPKLIKLLTGFNEDDENFGLCVKYAYSRILCHRYLSVNSHEIRRSIEGLAERFMAANYTQYGEHLKKLCDEFVADPLCIDHYEYDIQWSILKLLLELSRNPVSALAENKSNIELSNERGDADNALNRQENDSLVKDLLSSMIASNNQLKHNTQANESDLSDWSEDEDEIKDSDINVPTNQSSRFLDKSIAKLMPQHLEPPQKPLPFIEYDSSKSVEWLHSHVQHSWWNNESQAEVGSVLIEANTCERFQKHLKMLSGGLMSRNMVSTVSEWCMLREIIWMLQLEPQSNLNDDTKATKIEQCSKFFSIDHQTSTIIVNKNVSLASVTLDGIKAILTDLAENMTILYRFRQLYQSVTNPVSSAQTEDATIVRPPHSIECYVSGLREFIEIISYPIANAEVELMKQDPMELNTVVKFYHEMEPHFRLLKQLYSIHKRSYLDFKSNPAHICTLHLLAGLTHSMDTASSLPPLNLATSLFLVSIKFYLFLFNNWWIEGRFDDWREEFPIDFNRTTDDNSLGAIVNLCQLRSLSSISQERSKNLIKNCDVITLFSQESLEAGYLLNILYNLDKLTDMKQQLSLNEDSNSLYEAFLGDVLKELAKFDRKLVDESEANERTVGNEVEQRSKTISQQHASDRDLKKFLMNSLDADNDLLCLVFDTCNMNSTTPESNEAYSMTKSDETMSCYRIYKKLNELTDFHLPMSTIIFGVLENLLQARVSIANKYVLKIYTDEYNVLQHLYNLAKVYLFGAGDLMMTFYSKLFNCMNTGENWNNPYLLTIQLDGILSSRYPNLQSMFSVQVGTANCHEKEPLDAINDITINYVVRDSIRDVISDKNLFKYNAVFRFLLQIKWAMWTLETLRFPLVYKKRRPYQALTMIDLVFKRLAMLRNWIIYSVQCIHSHLMTFVIQSMGEQLNKKVKKVDCLRSIIKLHDSYINTIYEHCFRKSSDSSIRTGIEQLLNLVVVLNDEWNNLVALEVDNGKEQDVFDLNSAVAQVSSIESTYINCHCYIAEVLSKEVYTKDRTYLSALSAAFNCSCPY